MTWDNVASLDAGAILGALLRVVLERRRRRNRRAPVALVMDLRTRRHR